MIVCTGVPPWIVLDLLVQSKTQCLFTYIRSGSVSHYFPVGSQKLFFSRTGFVYVKNWKNSGNSSISQLCFLFVFYLRFIITLVNDMFDLQIDKKKKQNTNVLSSMNKSCEKKNQQHIVKIFYMWMFCITLKEWNTKRFVQNWHSPSHLRQDGHDFV
jgi:hypothetical protein